MESFYKVKVKGNKEILVSAVNPMLYADRFLSFLAKEVLINEDLQREREEELSREEIDSQIQKLELLVQ